MDSRVAEATCNLAVPDGRQVRFHCAMRELCFVEVRNKQQKRVFCGWVRCSLCLLAETQVTSLTGLVDLAG